MAITRDKKHALVAELTDLLADAKLTAYAQYQGLSVKQLQELRRKAREAGVAIKVVKNRLVRVAIAQTPALKDADTSALEGQLVYAISADDEVSPAQVLHAFSKEHPELKLVGGISNDGNVLDTDSITALAALPGKDQLIAEVIAQLLSPVHDTTNALSGNLHALLDGIEAKAAA